MAPSAFFANWPSLEVSFLSEATARRAALQGRKAQRCHVPSQVETGRRGAGNGNLAVELRRRGAHVTGIDASKDMINAPPG
jgi:2-polyprenyl-3-methyl-5-hydroxy-6-metoxy-1,4-benzoquinol methylase